MTNKPLNQFEAFLVIETVKEQCAPLVARVHGDKDKTLVIANIFHDVVLTELEFQTKVISGPVAFDKIFMMVERYCENRDEETQEVYRDTAKAAVIFVDRAVEKIVHQPIN